MQKDYEHTNESAPVLWSAENDQQPELVNQISMDQRIYDKYIQNLSSNYYVSLYDPNGRRYRTTNDSSSFIIYLQAILRNPVIESLSIRNMYFDKKNRPTLLQIIKDKTTISSLEMHFVGGLGGNKGFNLLIDSIRANPSIRNFNMQGAEYKKIDYIIKNLYSIPHLTTIRVNSSICEKNPIKYLNLQIKKLRIQDKKFKLHVPALLTLTIFAVKQHLNFCEKEIKKLETQLPKNIYKLFAEYSEEKSDEESQIEWEEVNINPEKSTQSSNVNNLPALQHKRKLASDSKSPAKKAQKTEEFSLNSTKRFYNFSKKNENPKEIQLLQAVPPEKIATKINKDRISFEKSKRTANEGLPNREILTLISHQNDMKNVKRRPKFYFSKDDKEHMLRCGAAGEESTYAMFKDFWKNEKNYKIINEDDSGFEAQRVIDSEITTITLTWINKSVWYKRWIDETPERGKTWPYDIKITKTIKKLNEEQEKEDDKYPRYVEVKSTTSNHSDKAGFTENESRWLRENNANYWICRVFNAGQEDCKIRRFRMPLSEEEIKSMQEMDYSFTVEI